MVKLPKAVRDSYWWGAEGEVLIEPNSIESIEQIYDHTPGGSHALAYVLITMRSGVQHRVLKHLDEVEKMIYGTSS